MSVSSKSLTQLLGKNIYRRRKSLGMTQEELAELVDIGQQSLSRMEQGHIAPKIERLQLFADNLRCPVADLFRSDDEKDAQIVDRILDSLERLEKEKREMVVDLLCHFVDIINR